MMQLMDTALYEDVMKLISKTRGFVPSQKFDF
jgi:GTP cyclohydrolase III